MVGGGIAGLAAAYAVRRAMPQVCVTVCEAGPQLGGKIRTAEVAGKPVDVGADSMLARVPDGVDLVRAVGLGDAVTSPATTRAGVYLRGRIRPLPARTVLGVPADLATLARSRILSPVGLARVPADWVLPGSPVHGDVAVGALVTRRLGREVVDRLVDPLLGGVYAGRADELSLTATIPQLAEPASQQRSLLLAARAALPAAAASGPVFAGVAGGLGRLAAATAAASGAEIRTDCVVRELHRTATGFRLVTGPVPAPHQLTADAVVLAVPARPAGRLLRAVAPAAASELAGVDYASVAVVTTAWPTDAFPTHPTGSGFLVPASEGRAVKAVTFTSSKWPQPHQGDIVLVRASVGRYGDDADLRRDDADLADLVVAELSALTGARGRPADALVTRWGGALPQYVVGHRDRIERVHRAVAVVPGLAVCGAAYDGVGVPACIRSATAAADQVAAHLRAGRQSTA